MAFSPNSNNSFTEQSLIALTYKNHIGMLAVNFFATLVVFWILHSAPITWLNSWGLAFLILMFLRFLGEFGYRTHKRMVSEISMRSLLRWRVAFRGGLWLSGTLWAFIAIAALPHATETQMLSTLLIISAQASGATAVLAPDKIGGRVYITCLLLPSSISLLLISTPLPLLTFLGCIFLVVMLISHTNNHRLIIDSLQLTFQNEELLRHSQSQNAEILALNSELEGRVKERTAALEHMASRDNLTCLLNRSGLINQLTSMLSHTQSFHVYFLDLDKFKQINDSKGHEVGDKVLKHITKNCSENVPSNGLLARWGGDEFVFCLPGEQCKDQVLHLIFSGISSPIEIDNEMMQVGVTIGYAVYPDDAETINDAIGAADLAATELKKQGRRGELLRFNKNIAVSLERRTLITELLSHKDLGEHFYVEYQPIVDNQQNIIALEALCRINAPTLGSVTPDEFIAIAEENGKVHELGKWVLNEACRYLTSQISAGNSPIMSVNVSPIQMKNPRFSIEIKEVLDKHHLPSHLIALEMTESFLEHEEVDRIIDRLNQIVEQGIHIYIDDFGTGYSSLSRLRDLPVHTLKIDRYFIASLEDEGDELVDSILYLANKFGLDVIAEGVETDAQFVHLQKLGCQNFQGFLFGRPTPDPLQH